MTYYNDWPDPDDQPSTTYKSQGVHKNRDTTSKMEVEAFDREGITDSARSANEAAAQEAIAQQTAMNASSMRQQQAIEPGELVVARGNKDATQEIAKAGGKATQKAAARIDAGQYLPPVPGGGTQASYGDGEPAGGGGGGSIDVNVNMEGMGDMGGGEGGGMSSMGGGGGGGGGGMSGGGGGGGGGMGSGWQAQMGKDIASMDDTRDQAHEALFQDDTDIESMQAIAENLQGR